MRGAQVQRSGTRHIPPGPPRQFGREARTPRDPAARRGGNWGRGRVEGRRAGRAVAVALLSRGAGCTASLGQRRKATPPRAGPRAPRLGCFQGPPRADRSRRGARADLSRAELALTIFTLATHAGPAFRPNASLCTTSSQKYFDVHTISCFTNSTTPSGGSIMFTRPERVLASRAGQNERYNTKIWTIEKRGRVLAPLIS